LFKKGVSLVSTTVKPDNLMELALTDYDAFKKTLEGKLPQIYMRDTHKDIKPNRIDPLKSYATKRP
jgi:hypothetical protein